MIKLNRYNEKPLVLYQELYKIVKDKKYFVLSTNVDGQFYNSRFDKNKVLKYREIIVIYNVKMLVIINYIIIKNYPLPMLEIRSKTISFNEDTNKVIKDLNE